MHSRVLARFGGKDTAMGPFTASETVSVDGAELTDFALAEVRQARVNDSMGDGTQTTLTGNTGSVSKTVVVTVHDRFPRMAFFEVQYRNDRTSDLRVTGWTNNRYAVAVKEGDA